METTNDIQIVTDDEAGTLEVARTVGSRLKGHEVIELVGDVGSGKTVFVKGLAKGMGILSEVSSPSFTISNEYKAESLTLMHYDFYRLDDPGIMLREIAEQLADEQLVVVIEWPEIIEGILPGKRIMIKFTSPRENQRNIRLSMPAELQYVLPAKYLTR